MVTLKVTKGNIVLELTGSRLEIKDIITDILDMPTNNRRQFSPPVIKGTVIKPSVIESSPMIIGNNEERLPTEQELVDYIVSKPDFEHNSAEIQQRFLKRYIKSKDEMQLYHRFIQVLRNAREDIAIENNGKWIEAGSITLQGKSHVMNYKFVKQEEVEPSTQTEHVVEVKSTTPVDAWE